ncbi:hypothetical protein, partial [Actinotignum sanguinis]|uniref:hypothetical protein n=1 Tax=Actinotignum sanguinis TaxID=1445614 RepID=UPI0025515EBA
MTSIDDRIVLAAWPALVVAVLVLPLPGVPFVIAFAVLVSVFVLLARSNLVLRLGKVTIGALWLVSLACLVYFFITFGAGVVASVSVVYLYPAVILVSACTKATIA